MKERKSEERLEENLSKLWLCMNLIIDQAMMENSQFPKIKEN